MDDNAINKGAHAAGEALDACLEISAGSDVPVLLQAKERAKKLVTKEPSAQNLAALQRASEMLEAAMTASSGEVDFFKNAQLALKYLQDDCQRKIEKTKFYDDARAGLCPKHNRGFRKRDLDRYAASLPKATTPEGRHKEAVLLQRRKDEADARIKEATAAREEIKTAALQGRYVLREQVEQELAGRAITLQSGLSSRLEAIAVDLSITAGGKPTNAQPLFRAIMAEVNAAMHDYSKVIEFEVNVVGGLEEDEHEDAD